MKDSSKKMPHSEILFKNLIVSLLNQDKKAVFDKTEEENIDLEKNDYKALKRKNYDDLIFKSTYSPAEKYEIDFSSEITQFHYENQVVTSTYSWVIQKLFILVLN